MYGDEDRDTDEEASSSDISQEGADAVRTTRHQGGFVCVRARACVVVRACVRAYVLHVFRRRNPPLVRVF